MKHYLRIYKRLLIINFAVFTAYKGNFVNHLISGSLWSIFSIVSMLIVTSNVTEVLGWKRHEILILTGISQIIISFQHMFFSSNLERFPLYVEQGRLDSYLLKPVDSQILVSVWLIRLMSFSRLFLAIVFLVYLVNVYHVDVSIWNIVGFIPLIICGIIILYSVWFMVTTLTIWFTRLTNIPEIMYSLNSATRFPPEVYREVTIFLFVVLFPLLLIGATPARQFLGTLSLPSYLFMILVAAVLSFVARQFWKFALRSYTSASS